MNYNQSAQILATIKRANNILVNCHRHPDPDSIGSALALKHILQGYGKRVRVVCPTLLDKSVSFLKGYDDIEVVDLSKFIFSKFDVFITLDSAAWEQVLRDNIEVPKILSVNIDHHKTNTNYGNINLVDSKMTSTAEILYKIFYDWEANIDANVANCLLTGIMGDTGALRYPRVSADTFVSASNLIVKGADKDFIIQKLYASVDLKELKFWGEILLRSQVDKQGNFFWSAISNDIYSSYGFGEDGLETSPSSMFAQIVAGTDFGFIALETKPKVVKISIRSRTGFDTTKIALELNGGGHVYASGGKIEGLSFKKAIEKVIKIARKHAKDAI